VEVVKIIDELSVPEVVFSIEALSGDCQNADVTSVPRPPLEDFAMFMVHANRFTEIEML
jgi:hypothetical protein